MASHGLPLLSKLKVHDPGFSLEQWWNAYSQNTRTFNTHNEFSDSHRTGENWNKSPGDFYNKTTKNSPRYKYSSNFNTERYRTYEKEPDQNQAD